MKTHSPNPSRPLAQTSLSAAILKLSLLISAAGLALGASSARAAEMNIGVRTKVVDGWVHPDGKHPAEGGHSKVFGLLAVDEVKSEQPLVKPVDVQYLKGLLLRELAANGFRPYTKGQKPDILLTLSYGRGNLRNPYMDDTGDMGVIGGQGGGDPGGGTGKPGIGEGRAYNVVSGDARLLFDEISPTYRAKLAKSELEKLFIRVTAWSFPKSPTDKPKMLWKTIIVADDPDNRDLNAIAAEMLAAGAPLFDKETKDKEVDLYKPLPEGRVNVGTPEVVEPATPKTK